MQWEYSYNKVNWTAISGATSANYYPGPCSQTTYFHRVSTHYLYKKIPPSFTYDQWYISNVVTVVTTPLPPPVPSQPAPTVCVSNITSVTVSVNASDNAVSYNWTVPTGWTINGGGQSATTASTSITVTPPAGTQTKDYPIYITANASCGTASSPATGYVRVGNFNNVPAPNQASFINGSYSTTCHPTYDLITNPINGATSYQATLNGSSVAGVINSQAYSVRFPFNFQVNQAGGVTVSATITATSPCGTSPAYSTGPQQLNGPTGSCPYAKTNAVQRPAGQATYPNPATDQVIVRSVNQEAQASFYDGQGVCRKTVSLHAQNDETSVNLRDLPAGLYQVRVSTGGKILRKMQLVVQH